MKTILQILKQAGGWHHGLSLKIENPPFMALVIEATDESGPCGLPVVSIAHLSIAHLSIAHLSIAHYGEQNGDLMRDPEMCFELGFAAGAHLTPFYFRNDYLGIEQFSRTIEGDNYVFDRNLYDQHEKFAGLWDKNLSQQGFVEAFDRRGTQH